MKKIILFFLLLGLFKINPNAQEPYKHCLDEGIVKWSVLDYHVADAGLISTDLFAYGDTLINGIPYKKLMDYYFNHFDVDESNTQWKNYIPDHYSGDPYYFNLWENFFIRESEDASKLYVLDTYNNEEYLISNINLQEGDQFQIPNRYSGNYSVEVDSVYIEDGLKHVRLDHIVNLSYGYGPDKLTFIEGVGPNTWILYPFLVNGRDEATLNCFQNQSIFYKKEVTDGPYICPCGYISPFQSINDVDFKKDYNLIVKRDNIEILFSMDENVQIVIYEISGRSCYNKNFPLGNKVIIPTSSFPKGVYILKVSNKEKKQFLVNKIIL
jgi:hypothetical protein